jgi:hypothetical protein
MFDETKCEPDAQETNASSPGALRLNGLFWVPH